MQALPNQLVTSSGRRVPVSWIYGSNSWIDIGAGLRLHQTLQNEGHDGLFRIVERAGHHVFCDNAERFNEVILEVLRYAGGVKL